MASFEKKDEFYWVKNFNQHDSYFSDRDEADEARDSFAVDFKEYSDSQELEANDFILIKLNDPDASIHRQQTNGRDILDLIENDIPGEFEYDPSDCTIYKISNEDFFHVTYSFDGYDDVVYILAADERIPKLMKESPIVRNAVNDMEDGMKAYYEAVGLLKSFRDIAFDREELDDSNESSFKKAFATEFLKRIDEISDTYINPLDLQSDSEKLDKAYAYAFHAGCISSGLDYAKARELALEFVPLSTYITDHDAVVDEYMANDYCLKQINKIVAQGTKLLDELNKGGNPAINFERLYAIEFTEYLNDNQMVSENKVNSMVMEYIDSFNKDFVNCHIRDVDSLEDFQSLKRTLQQIAPEKESRDIWDTASWGKWAEKERLVYHALQSRLARSIIDHDIRKDYPDAYRQFYASEIKFHGSSYSSYYDMMHGNFSLGISYMLKSSNDIEERHLAFATTELFDDSRMEGKEGSCFALENMQYVLTNVPSEEAIDHEVERNMFLVRHTAPEFADDNLKKDYSRCSFQIVDKILRIATDESREEAFREEMKKRLMENYSANKIEKVLGLQKYSIQR